jgi:hypothetical protein
VLGDAGLLGTASVDGALSAPFDAGGKLENGFPSLLPAELFRHQRLDLVGIGIQEQLATPKAYALEHVLDHVEKLDIEYRLGKHDVAKVSWAKVVLLLASDTNLVVLDDTHAGVKESVSPWLGSIESVGPVDLGHRPGYDVLWAKDAKLDTSNWIDIVFIRELIIHGHVCFDLYYDTGLF